LPLLRHGLVKEYKHSAKDGKNVTVYAERRKKVIALAKGKQPVAMTGANLFYLTDFWGGGSAIVYPDRTVVITPPLESKRAEQQGQEVEVIEVKTWGDVSRRVDETVRGKVVVDDNRELGKSDRYTADPRVFLRARRTKDEEEVARIRRASRGLDKIFEALSHELKIGRTEWEVAAEVMRIATREGLTPSGSDSALSPTIIASGPNGALPHSELTNRRIRNGDFVVADIFFRYKGYNSDETRTFAVGSATSEMKKNYAAVLEAQEEALQSIRSGIPCANVNAKAVGVLREHGVEKFLNHSIGHGVGIDIHELPGINRTTREILARNDIVTDEPGVYIPGKYGIRIEDTVQTDSKPVVLTKYTKELVTSG